MSTLVAKRYAKALIASGRHAGITTALDDDVAAVRETVEQSRDLRLLFASPVVSREKKIAVVRALFRERVHDLVVRFLELLVEKNRESLFAEIASAYRELRDDELGIVEAVATTPRPMTAETESGLRSVLERQTGKRIRLRVETDPSLIGGLVVRIGDIVHDGSVSNSLAQLREQFEGGSFRRN